MTTVPSVYLVNQDQIANTLTMRLLQSVQIDCQDFITPTDLLNHSDFYSPCCFLISFLLPEMNGIELMLNLRKKGLFHPCIFTSSQFDSEFLMVAMHERAFGFIKKPYNTRELIEVVQKAIKFDALSNKYVRSCLIYKKKLKLLSPREKEILKLLLEDLSASKISEELGISPRTVENHRHKIFAKLEVTKLSGLIRAATTYETLTLFGYFDDFYEQ